MLKRLIEFQIIVLHKPISKELMKHEDIASFVNYLRKSNGIGAVDDSNLSIPATGEAKVLPGSKSTE